MDNKPKNTTRTRSMIGGGTKTVTKSKGVDAQGTMTKRRTVTKSKEHTGRLGETPGRLGRKMSVTKDVIKQKYASGATRKVKTLSSQESKKVGGQKYERTISATKQKVVGPGILNKAKSLAKPAQKTGYHNSFYNGTLSYGGQKNYESAKARVQGLSKKISKK